MDQGRMRIKQFAVDGAYVQGRVGEKARYVERHEAGSQSRARPCKRGSRVVVYAGDFRRETGFRADLAEQTLEPSIQDKRPVD